MPNRRRTKHLSNLGQGLLKGAAVTLLFMNSQDTNSINHEWLKIDPNMCFKVPSSEFNQYGHNPDHMKPDDANWPVSQKIPLFGDNLNTNGHDANFETYCPQTRKKRHKARVKMKDPMLFDQMMEYLWSNGLWRNWRANPPNILRHAQVLSNFNKSG